MPIGGKLRTAAALGVCGWACAIAACSGGAGSPEQAVGRMIGAFGGKARVERMSSFIGRGFMRDMTATKMTINDPFDVYHEGQKVKTVTMRVSRGQLIKVNIILNDGNRAFRYRYPDETRDMPPWESDIQKYMFPRVFSWLADPAVPGEIVRDAGLDGKILLQYHNQDDIIIYTIDDETWLLDSAEIRSESDSSFSYRESYGDYREIDGGMFPNRFTGSYKGRPYYEYFIPVIEYGIDIPDSIFAILPSDTTGIGPVNVYNAPVKVDGD